jgi:hypothetical protein
MRANRRSPISGTICPSWGRGTNANTSCQFSSGSWLKLQKVICNLIALEIKAQNLHFHFWQWQQGFLYRFAVLLLISLNDFFQLENYKNYWILLLGRIPFTALFLHEAICPKTFRKKTLIFLSYSTGCM